MLVVYRMGRGKKGQVCILGLAYKLGQVCRLELACKLELVCRLELAYKLGLVCRQGLVCKLKQQDGLEHGQRHGCIQRSCHALQSHDLTHRPGQQLRGQQKQRRTVEK